MPSEVESEVQEEATAASSSIAELRRGLRHAALRQPAKQRGRLGPRLEFTGADGSLYRLDSSSLCGIGASTALLTGTSPPVALLERTARSLDELGGVCQSVSFP